MEKMMYESYREQVCEMVETVKANPKEKRRINSLIASQNKGRVLENISKAKEHNLHEGARIENLAIS
jgi:hypothetical protein